MRGTPTSCLIASISAGIIPAYAGNTRPHHPSTLDIWDHPRVCGEHGMADIGDALSSGSSPRMRGTLLRVRIPDGAMGIIPAYAGNTVRQEVLVFLARDHPRVCGEHRCQLHDRQHAAGSSPRMRGTPLGRRPRRGAGGIIPAYAGNTFSKSSNVLLMRDHPRVCGEHLHAPVRTAIR